LELRRTINQKKFKFPNGANVSLLPCGSDRELENFDGGQFSYIIIDEAQNHSFEQFSYLMGRNRSMSKYPPRMVLTCNPLKGNWLLGFVEWYLDKDTGIPLKELANTIRFFSIIGGKIVTASSAEELLLQYPTCTPKTYRFIPATIFDNPVIQKVNPGYLSNLENLKTKETAVCQAFADTITAAGYRAGVYASYAWIKNYINTDALYDCSLWVARYNNTTTSNTKSGTPYSDVAYDYEFWQYSSAAKIDGYAVMILQII
jgi:hypothetical protein